MNASLGNAILSLERTVNRYRVILSATQSSVNEKLVCTLLYLDAAILGEPEDSVRGKQYKLKKQEAHY